MVNGCKHKVIDNNSEGIDWSFLLPLVSVQLQPGTGAYAFAEFPHQPF